MIRISNKQQLITSHNYYESDYAKNGYCYLSFNAACFRLLVAPALLPSMPDMRAAKTVLIGYGHSETRSRPMLRIVFDDASESPFLIDLSREQADFVLIVTKRKRQAKKNRSGFPCGFSHHLLLTCCQRSTKLAPAGRPVKRQELQNHILSKHSSSIPT